MQINKSYTIVKWCPSAAAAAGASMHILRAHLLMTMLHCPVVALHANALQLLGWLGQGVGQWLGLQLPDWQVPLGPEDSSSSSSGSSSSMFVLVAEGRLAAAFLAGAIGT
jgi:hypothetical protein